MDKTKLDLKLNGNRTFIGINEPVILSKPDIKKKKNEILTKFENRRKTIISSILSHYSLHNTKQK